jgi:putative membrane protein
MKNVRNILVAIACAAAAGACNNSGTADSATTDSATVRTDTSHTATGTVAEKDAQFLMDVAAANMAEIRLAQLAQQKGNAKEMKDIGKMLETDHSAVLGDLRNFASARSVTLPAEEKPEAKSYYNDVSAKTGKEFDKDMCGHLIEAHKNSIKKFEDAQTDLSDAEIKTWTTNVLPKLRNHLSMLEDAQNKLK